MGFSIQHGFDFEAAEKAYDDHAKLLMALKALPSERLLRHLAHQRKGRRDRQYPLNNMLACFVAMMVYNHEPFNSVRRELMRNRDLRYACFGRNDIGYKLHLLVDAEYEPPVAFAVTGANVNDAPALETMLGQHLFMHPAMKPESLALDGAYDGNPTHKYLWERDILPVIHKNKTTRKEPEGIFDMAGVRVRNRQPDALQGAGRMNVRGMAKTTTLASLSLLCMLGFALAAARQGQTHHIRTYAA